MLAHSLSSICEVNEDHRKSVSRNLETEELGMNPSMLLSVGLL